MKGIEQYFSVVLFIMLYKVVRTLESVDDILTYDHSNETSSAGLPCGVLCLVFFLNFDFHCSWELQGYII